MAVVLCRIFQFENFSRTKKRVLSQEDDEAALVRTHELQYTCTHGLVCFTHVCVCQCRPPAAFSSERPLNLVWRAACL